MANSKHKVSESDGVGPMSPRSEESLSRAHRAACGTGTFVHPY